MTIERSYEFVAVGFFLSSFGEKHTLPVGPPHELGASSWRHAYIAFYDALGGGRSIRTFSNSLKATRDAFDAWVDSGRVGWREDGNPKPLSPIESRVFTQWWSRPREELWAFVEQFADASAAACPVSVINDLDVLGAPAPNGGTRTEGGRRVRVLATVERSPGLRAKALQIHGASCMVCMFDFGKVYGVWGQDFAEVHHIEPLSEDPERVRETNPAVDLAVVCANCHRMLHRQRDLVLDLDELRTKVDRQAIADWLQQLLVVK